MARLEELQAGTRVLGLAPGPAVTVKSTSWIGQQAVELVFEGAAGTLLKRLVYREDEHAIEVAQAGRPWSFDADGHLFRLVSEAHRIKFAWLRFLLADDPGAGKTIMAGLLIKELVIRGDLERCLMRSSAHDG